MKFKIRLKNPKRSINPYDVGHGHIGNLLESSKSIGFTFPKSKRFDDCKSLQNRSSSLVGPATYSQEVPKKIKGGLIYTPVHKSNHLQRSSSSEMIPVKISKLLEKKSKFNRSLSNKRTTVSENFFSAGDKFFITKYSPII